MLQVIELDFKKDILLWYENPKSIEVINKLKEKIKLWIELPLVNVFLINNWSYSLCPITKIKGLNWINYIDWWHHRSIAYFQELWKMKVKLILKPNMPIHMLQEWYIDITKISLINQPELLEYKQSIFWNYY